MKRQGKIAAAVGATAVAFFAAFATPAGRDAYSWLKQQILRPKAPQETTVTLDFEDFQPLTPLEAQIQQRGILFENTLVERLRYPVSGHMGIRSNDRSKPIVILFPTCAKSVRVRIDADGNSRRRQPQAWAYNNSGQRIGSKNFGGGKSQVALFFDIPIARVELGAVPTRGRGPLSGTDSFDVLEVELLRGCG